MLDVMFDIPRSDEKREVIITEKCITEGAQPEVKPVTA
jgi:ATP-dependent Clp protease ATP-binding subunit ClpX